jgi:hypothetical protein
LTICTAHRILARCADALTAEAATPTTDWRYLAGGYVLLGDTEAACRCLERGGAPGCATSVDHLCALAESHRLA